MQWVEWNRTSPAAGAGSRYRCLNHHRAAKLFRPASNVQCVQALNGRATLGGSGDQVHGTCAGINHRRSRDPVYRVNAAGCNLLAIDLAGNRCNALSRINEAVLPKRSAAEAVRVEGIYAVVLRGHINHIVRALARNTHVRNVKWLGIDLTIHRIGKQFPEGARVYVRWSEHRLTEVLAT